MGEKDIWVADLALFSNVTDGVKNPGRLQPQAAINKGNAWFLANSVSGVLSLFSDKRNLAAAAQSTVIISTSSPTVGLSGQNFLIMVNAIIIHIIVKRNDTPAPDKRHEKS